PARRGLFHDRRRQRPLEAGPRRAAGRHLHATPVRSHPRQGRALRPTQARLRGRERSMDVIDEVTSECLDAINQLRELEGAAVSPEPVRRSLCGFIDGMRKRARDRGLADRDTQDILYAIVALADEVALGAPEPLRGFWMGQPLQMQYFNENLAGEG